jgi:hypothetical protein
VPLTASSGAAPLIQTAPNMFQGLASGNTLTFFGVPILPPATSGVTRVFRITNVRVNAAGITGGGPIATGVTAIVSASGATSVPIGPSPQLTVGFVNTSLTTSVRVTQSSAFSFANSLTAPVQCVNPAGNGNIFAQATLRYTELFGTAFKTRTSPVANILGGGAQGTSLTGSPVPGTNTSVQQNVPGNVYNSESGFIQPSVTGNGFTAGLADFGTRVKAVFNNIPSGLSVYVTTTNMASNTALVSSPVVGSTYAVLVSGETAAETSGTPPALLSNVNVSSSSNKTPIANSGLYQLQVVNGSATAVWEVIGTIPTTLENLDFGVALGYTGSPATNSPAPGTMTVNMSYAPTPSQGAFTASAGAVAQGAGFTIPRFIDTSTASNVATVSICTTSLLFPFVTNTNGFDTGIAISNTSLDPFGTAAQGGTCNLNWYGNATASSNPAATPLGGGGVASTTPIPAGTVQTVLLSTTVPNFQGYMIAVCNFQFAHGFAFVSDLGSQKLAMGYLALVMNSLQVANQLTARPVGPAENLVQ